MFGLLSDGASTLDSLAAARSEVYMRSIMVNEAAAHRLVIMPLRFTSVLRC